MNNLQVLATRQIGDTFFPNSILTKYYELNRQSKRPKKWEDVEEDKLWQELCFCILSANVSFELAKSVIHRISDNNMLNPEWIIEDKTSESTLFNFLDGSNFEPVKKNGELRRYRYPKVKSQQIVNAAKRIYCNNSIKEILNEFDSDVLARNFFYTEIAGLGIKEASHFLRNIGFATSLAIIDVHVFNFLKEFSLIDFEIGTSLTLKNYLLLEKTLKNLSEYHGLDLSILDLAIWQSMKNGNV